MISPAHMEELRNICAGVKVMAESGIEYIFLPNLTVVTNAATQELDALLCPSHHPSGYMTRLFLSAPFRGAGQSNNWTEHRILERQWHTWSWQHVSANQAPAQILAAHLRALR